MSYTNIQKPTNFVGTDIQKPSVSQSPIIDSIEITIDEWEDTIDGYTQSIWDNIEKPA